MVKCCGKDCIKDGLPVDIYDAKGELMRWRCGSKVIALCESCLERATKNHPERKYRIRGYDIGKEGIYFLKLEGDNP